MRTLTQGISLRQFSHKETLRDNLLVCALIRIISLCEPLHKELLRGNNEPPCVGHRTENLLVRAFTFVKYCGNVLHFTELTNTLAQF